MATVNLVKNSFSTLYQFVKDKIKKSPTLLVLRCYYRTQHQSAAESLIQLRSLEPSFYDHNKSIKRCLYRHLFPVYTGFFFYLTRSMICLMVCRRMMPELFWSVPASLGSLSAHRKNGQNHCITSATTKKKKG